MKNCATAAIVLAGLLSPGLTYAQAVPACENTYSDADGDGFGWENSSSCRITADSIPAPEFTNLATGESVALARAYWSAPRDIEERDIQCEGFFFDSAQSSYQPVRTWEAGNSLQNRFTTDISLHHNRISAEAPKLGYIELSGTRGLIDAYPMWTLNDGIYSGLAGFQGAYLEQIVRNGVAAVRRWQKDDTYTDCFVAGSAFTPTGVPGESPPTYQPASDSVVITDFSNRIPGDEELSVTNLETNQTVILERVYWDIQKDLVGKAVYCQNWEWNQNNNEYNFYSNYYADTHYFLHPSPTTPNVYPVVTAWYDNVSGATLSVNDGVVSGSREVISRYVERISAWPNYQPGIRIWESDQKYRQCRLEGEFGSSQQSGNRFDVQPVDYGLNPSNIDPGNINPGTTPPTTESQCIDPDGDGWGWNGTSSCRVETTVVTQPIVTTQQCADPDGDGWGWNGTSSCRVESAVVTQPIVTPQQCVDPDGDGWGWNGTSSCTVEPTTVEPTVAQECIDSDGDGWGWDGSASCRV